MRLIFVAGPYSGNTPAERAVHVERGKRLCLELLLLGYAVHCPWLDSGYDEIETIPGCEKIDIYAPKMVERLQANSRAILERLDPERDAILLAPGYQGSKGANEDLFLARKREIRVFYDAQVMLRLFPPEGR